MRNVVCLLAATRWVAVALGLVAVVALLSAPVKVGADGGSTVPSNPFVVLLKGIYEPVVSGPDLGLSLVDLDDGTYAKCKIYRVSGLPGTTNEAVGNFWVNFDVTLCAYQLPGGTFAAVFTEFLYEEVVIDGELYQVGTAELVILEATGVYRPFVGGAIHMEFITRVIDMDAGIFDENCLCYISR